MGGCDGAESGIGIHQDPPHHAATSCLVVLGPCVGAWATTTSQAKRGHEIAATRTRGSREQAMTPL
eukprot:1795087-Alexandrium_andersonii.AAC.1